MPCSRCSSSYGHCLRWFACKSHAQRWYGWSCGRLVFGRGSVPIRSVITCNGRTATNCVGGGWLTISQAFIPRLDCSCQDMEYKYVICDEGSSAAHIDGLGAVKSSSGWEQTLCQTLCATTTRTFTFWSFFAEQRIFRHVDLSAAAVPAPSWRRGLCGGWSAAQPRASHNGPSTRGVGAPESTSFKCRRLGSHFSCCVTAEKRFARRVVTNKCNRMCIAKCVYACICLAQDSESCTC